MVRAGHEPVQRHREVPQNLACGGLPAPIPRSSFACSAPLKVTGTGDLINPRNARIVSGRGQMVHLYCAERGFMPNRPTKDADAFLDVRAQPDIVDRFTSALIEMRWTSAGESFEGHQHRWTKDRSQIDVLILTYVRRTPLLDVVDRKHNTGNTGGQQALERAELVTIEVTGEVGQVPGPTWPAPWSSTQPHTNTQARFRDRHPDLTTSGAGGSELAD